MNILLTGASGQLGTELFPLLSQIGKVTGVDRVASHPGIVVQDLGDLHRVEIFLNRLRPDVVVNTAAFTAVDKAESDHATAFRLNAELPAFLGRWCCSNQRKLLHYSTDYVFDGSATRPYMETDPAAPINVYGESKRAGELAIANSSCEHVILRTSWVYSAHGNNFLLTMLRLASQRPELGVVSDQTGCPTWARNLARASIQILKALPTADHWREQGGTYHYCDATVTTWHDFARSIFDIASELGVLPRAPGLKAIASKDFPQAATRPMFSVLNTRKVLEQFGVMAPNLDESLRLCLADYRE